MSAPLTVLIDGVASVATHNGVHRVVGYRLDAKGPALKALLEALRKVEK